MITANQPISPIWDRSDYQSYRIGEDVAYFGITKREYFASQAMHGVLASEPDISAEMAAEFAVKAANALIAELNK